MDYRMQDKNFNETGCGGATKASERREEKCGKEKP